MGVCVMKSFMLNMATIKEDYCSREIYMLLIKKGFDGEIHTSFDDEGYTQPSITLQMAMKWLKEVHNLFVFPFPQMNTNKFWTEIYQLSDNQQWENLYCESINLQDYPTYEQACEAAIKYCLENLI